MANSKQVSAEEMFFNWDSDSEDEFLGFRDEEIGEFEMESVEMEKEGGGEIGSQRGESEAVPEEWRQVLANVSQTASSGGSEVGLGVQFNDARSGPQRVWSSQDPCDFFSGTFFS